jgi:hypothetical protein
VSNSISTLNSSADYSSGQRRNPHTQQIKWRDAVHDEIMCAVDDCCEGGREKGQNMAIGEGEEWSEDRRTRIITNSCND